MESLLHRYRNITVLFVAIVAQIAAVAWQVRRNNDVPLLRIWAVSAVTPVASVIENLRSGTFGVLGDVFSARGNRNESQAMRSELNELRLRNKMLEDELAAAQKAGALAGFKAHSPSKLVGARVTGATTGMGSRSVLIDQGKFAGVQKGMAVVTPDGIVGKVLEAYPFASQVLSVTDVGFAAGVESQKNHARGVMEGTGGSSARVDYVPNGQKVEIGEAFYTSGDDRVFPRGLPAGKVISVEEGPTFQEIMVEPFGAEATPEEVFVIVDPVHQDIPDAPATDAPVFLGPDTQPTTQPGAGGVTQTPSSSNGTQADQIVDQYRKIGAAQGHVFGEGTPGALPPNFNLKVPGVNAPAVAAGASGGMGAGSATGNAARAVTGNAARAATGNAARAATGNAARAATGNAARAATGNAARAATGNAARAATGNAARAATSNAARAATGNAAGAVTGNGAGTVRSGTALGASGQVRRVPRPLGASGPLSPSSLTPGRGALRP